MRGRRKYQSRKLLDSEQSPGENMVIARLGELKDRPGAMLAIEIRRLAQERAALEAMSPAESKLRSKEWGTVSRTRNANACLTKEAELGEAAFFRDFAEGLEFCVAQSPFGPADPIAVLCLQYAFLTHGQGSLTHLCEWWLAERLDEVPDIREVGRLCKKLGIKFTAEKRGRKSGK